MDELNNDETSNKFGAHVNLEKKVKYYCCLGDSKNESNVGRKPSYPRLDSIQTNMNNRINTNSTNVFE